MVNRLFCFFFPILLGANGTNSIVIETVYGPVEGSTMKTIDRNKTFYAFQGIPFAEPPIGNLRFKAPIPPKKWTSTWKANDSSRICPQLIEGGAEDCLYLNVYTPKIDGGLAVMVYIYGGYFVKGTSSITEFGPDYLIDEDVVLVTFNYRGGIFGFLCTEDSASPGNYAIKDQIFALKWVQSNIAKFGGDPNNVLVFGQSAGAASVSYLLESPAAKGLFHRVIMESGNSLMIWSYSQNPRLTAFLLGFSLGIFTTNSTKLVEELRNVDYDSLSFSALIILAIRTVLSNILDGFIFAPYIEEDTDGGIVVSKNFETFSSGDFIRVPVLLGFNSNEFGRFTTIISLIRFYMIQYDILISHDAPANMNASFLTKILAGFQIHWHYFPLRLVVLSSVSRIIKFVNDSFIVIGTYKFLTLVSNYIPTYLYYFSYEGELGDPTHSYEGVGHEEELYYIFNIKGSIENPPKQDLITRNRLVKLWTNFAKTGNPTPIKDGLLMDVEWTTFNNTTKTYLNINQTLQVRNDTMIWKNVEFWTKLYDKYGNPPYITY